MGIVVRYCRISSEMLATFLVEAHDEAVEHFITQGQALFPYSLHHFSLDKLSGLLHAFLNPEHDTTSLLWQVVEGGALLTQRHLPKETIYLEAVYFLRPEDVHAIARAMASLTYDDHIKRYCILMEVDEADVFTQTAFPTYQDMMRLFFDTFCFLRIAEEARDGLLRWHG